MNVTIYALIPAFILGVALGWYISHKGYLKKLSTAIDNAKKEVEEKFSKEKSAPKHDH